MTRKTKDYEIFKLREDNREKINRDHVNLLKKSIGVRNLLEFRPIVVNGDMEILDGQHRFLAARELDLDIYYNVEKSLKGEDILLLNTSKSWNSADYLNYYVKNGYEHYISLQTFIKKHGLSIKVALNITMGESLTNYKKYKEGAYVFTEKLVDENLDICWDTINYIKRMNGFSPYTYSARFWKALLKLVRHHNFDPAKWRANIERMVERFGVRAGTNEYLRMMMEIHNWKNSTKLNLIEED